MADFTIKHVVECPNLIEAINKLAGAISDYSDNVGACPIPGLAEPEKPVETMERDEQPTELAPAPTPEPVMAVEPAPPTEIKPTVTFQAIAEAGSALLEDGKMAELLALLDRMQVRALTELTPEQYPAIADGLRALGAKI